MNLASIGLDDAWFADLYAKTGYERFMILIGLADLYPQLAEALLSGSHEIYDMFRVQDDIRTWVVEGGFQTVSQLARAVNAGSQPDTVYDTAMLRAVS